MAQRDYYDILGVNRKATSDEIRKAHRRLVRQYHPDLNKNNPEAVEKFKEVQEAYDVLSDRTKRQNYDQFGHAGVGAQGQGGGPGVDPFEALRREAETRQRGGRGRGGPAGGPMGGRGPRAQYEGFEDMQGAADIFEQFFGGQAGRAEHREVRGQDIEYPVTLTFAQAARGMTLPLQINREGKLETIEVKVPAGVKDGSRVRLRGQGQQVSGGASGDLYIVTRVHPHPYFRREGLDVYLDLPLSLYEAMLGTKVEVPTLEGKVTLTVPAGTSGGAKLRLKGHGIERGADKGDQIVVVQVTVPKTLDAESRAALEKLAAKNPIDARADVKW